MPSKAPSIQSYFPTTSQSTATANHLTSSDTVVGEEDERLSTRLTSTNQKWQARIEYARTDIVDLHPGPGCVTVTGRIVNFHEQGHTSKSPLAAKGSFKVIVKDDTGPLKVRQFMPKCRTCRLLTTSAGQVMVH